MPDFLLEIGCEEIPARMIDAASQELRERVSALLSRERLAAGEITSFDTPRRLSGDDFRNSHFAAGRYGANHRTLGECCV